MVAAEFPVKVILPALVTILAPLNCSVPREVIGAARKRSAGEVGQVTVDVELAAAAHRQGAVVVKFPAVVKLAPPARAKLAPAAFVAKFARTFSLAKVNDLRFPSNE